VLGLVQYGGWPGFYLLAHGDAKRRGAGWPGLGQRLDDVRPHFGRVIVCVDRDAPSALGDALAGRPLEGWWAEFVGQLPGAAMELSGRLGIAFSGIDLAAFPEVVLELLGQRSRQLAPAQVPAPAAVAATTAPMALPVLEAVPVAPPEPVVLDCDLQVRQRLRFLAWMRRVQTETRREELEPVA
jgi:hypothetical protein